MRFGVKVWGRCKTPSPVGNRERAWITHVRGCRNGRESSPGSVSDKPLLKTASVLNVVSHVTLPLSIYLSLFGTGNREVWREKYFSVYWSPSGLVWFLTPDLVPLRTDPESLHHSGIRKRKTVMFTLLEKESVLYPHFYWNSYLCRLDFSIINKNP